MSIARLGLAVLCPFLSLFGAAPASAGNATLNLVVVIDGLRPDSWDSSTNEFGVPGVNYAAAGATGPISGAYAGHGSLSPWTVHNTFIAWGIDFKRGIVVNTPSSVGIAPTLLALMNLDRGIVPADFDGRVLSEAFANGPDGEQIPAQVRTHIVETADGTYRTALQVTELGRQLYIDKGWRIQ